MCLMVFNVIHAVDGLKVESLLIITKLTILKDGIENQ